MVIEVCCIFIEALISASTHQPNVHTGVTDHTYDTQHGGRVSSEVLQTWNIQPEQLNERNPFTVVLGFFLSSN